MCQPKERTKKKRAKDNRTETRTVRITLEPIARHRYSELIVRLTALLRVRIGCGSRSVVDVLDIINEVFNGILGEVPCHNTIDNWVKKCGLDVYNNAGTTILNKPYAQIVDESMMVGSNKLLLTLGVWLTTWADHLNMKTFLYWICR